MGELEISKQQQFLNSVYQNTQTAVQSISDIMSSVQSQELQKELQNQSKKYEKIGSECEDYANKLQINIKDNNWLEKARLWTSIKMTTFSDKTTRHIAEMMLLGTVMGLLTCFKDQKDYATVDKYIDKLLIELINLEQENYEKLKTFLSTKCED